MKQWLTTQLMQKENLLAILRFILYDVIVYNLRKVLIQI